MRHAESIFNERKEKLQEYVDKGDGKDLSGPERHELFKKLNYDYDLDIINGRLTEKGIGQCKDSFDKLKRYPNIKRVLISPMLRTIQTFENSMEEYVNFDELEVTMLEDLRENHYTANDLGYYSDEMKKLLKHNDKFDYQSFMKNHEDPNFWFVDSGSKDHVTKQKDSIKDCVSDEQKMEKYLEKMKEKYGIESYENPTSRYETAMAAKKKILDIVKENGYGDNEVQVVSHFGKLSFLTAISFDSEDLVTPTKGYYKMFKNCEVCSFEYFN